MLVVIDICIPKSSVFIQLISSESKRPYLLVWKMISLIINCKHFSNNSNGFISGSRIVGDNLNFYLRIPRQRGHLDCRSCRKIRCEVLSIDFVHRTKISQISHENSGFDYILKPQSLAFQNCLDILEYAA